MKKVYPVIFTKTDDKTYLIEVPDMEILTEGNDLQDAIEMARDAIGLKGICLEDEKRTIPEASEHVDASNGTFADDGESFVSMVDIDFDVYRRKIDNKSVRRNVTLPSWLNKEAEKAGINVSGVLREALMQRLGIEAKQNNKVCPSKACKFFEFLVCQEISILRYFRLFQHFAPKHFVRCCCKSLLPAQPSIAWGKKAKAMKAERIDIDTVAKVSGLTIEEIEKL